MKRKLFFTGDIGVGKSTAIAEALGDVLPSMGGFLTVRIRDGAGNPTAFALESPDRSCRAVFLDLSTGVPQVSLEVFDTLGTALLTPGVCILDEIGGIELLSPGFRRALDTLLAGDSPIIGVVKGPGPAGALIERLGLADEYVRAAEALRNALQNDPNTLLYRCDVFDPEAMRLAKQWAKEYVHDRH